MGDIKTEHHPFAAADTPSLHDLLDRVSADEQLDPRRRADLRSAIKSLGQWLGSDLTAMPAHPRYLRERLAGFHPAAADVSRKRLQNVRSAVAFVLDRYGLGGRRSYSGAAVAGSAGALRPPARQVLPVPPVATAALHQRAGHRARTGDRCRSRGVSGGARTALCDQARAHDSSGRLRGLEQGRAT